MWLVKPETARRVRQRIGTVMEWAKAAGYRGGDNPVEGVDRGMSKQGGDSAVHYAALPFADVPGFVTRLRKSEVGELTKLAFEFLILTAARTGEVIGARWHEIEEDRECLWTIPVERMKAGRAHRVPLSERCLAIVRQAKALGGNSPFVFTGRSGVKPLSSMVFLMALRRMGLAVTGHGFRSSFWDWASKATNFPREVCEMALAHTVEGKVEAAYHRGDLLQKRRELMQSWSVFIEPKAEEDQRY